MKIEYLNYEAIRSSANSFLEKYHPEKTIPVPIEDIIEFDLHIDIVPISGYRKYLDIDASISMDFSEIQVDEYVQESNFNRYRFSLAHEVGHFILHKNIYPELDIKTLGEWKQFLQSPGNKEYSWLETQANNFAGLVMVPYDRLHTAFTERYNQIRDNGFSPDRYKDYISGRLARDFAVSGQTMEIRISKESLWDKIT